MKNNGILILGNGILGQELYKQTKWQIISRLKDGFDITNISTYNKLLTLEYGAIVNCPWKVIINAIGYTNTYSNNKKLHWDTNYLGVANLVDFCNTWDIKLVQIVTDYIYANSKSLVSENDVPVHCENWYGYTKLLADGYVQLKCKEHLIIRATHKQEPFLYNDGWINQIGNFDYVSNICFLIIELINNKAYGIYNVGTELKSMYDLGKKTKVNIKPKHAPVNVPTDVSMNIQKMVEFLK